MDELDKLLSHSFEEIKQNGDLIIKLLQLSQNFLNLSITDCEKQHRSYYEKLKTIKNIPMAQKVNLLDKKYILKLGTPLYYNHTHFYNEGEADKAHTLTDQIAANAIKRFPALAGRFLSEKERAIMEAKDKAHHDITDAEAAIDEGEEKVKGEAEKKITDEVEKVEDEKAEAEKPKTKGKAATKKKKNNAK